jgi:short-subunit dehydrogenase
MDLKLAGKVALITGSSHGIGLATAKAFAAEGCRLMLSARSAEPLAEAQAALRTSVAEVAAHAADVSKPDEAAALGGNFVKMRDTAGGCASDPELYWGCYALVVGERRKI